jgi:transcriptional regulator with XRE-family HTH domain
MNKRKSTKFDKAIAKKVQIARLAAKLSQKKLGEDVGVSLQQIQKYENGVNRIGAGRIYQIAVATSLPLDFFFSYSEQCVASNQSSRKDLAVDAMQRLVMAAAMIKCPKLLRNLSEAAESFANTPDL